MPKFIVRVQINVETQVKYTSLRNGLLNIGFTKRVKDSTGTEYRLPNGNYYIDSSGDRTFILTAVQNIALKIENSPMIVVAEIAPKGLAWFGLEKC